MKIKATLALLLVCIAPGPAASSSAGEQGRHGGFTIHAPQGCRVSHALMHGLPVTIGQAEAQPFTALILVFEKPPVPPLAFSTSDTALRLKDGRRIPATYIGFSPGWTVGTGKFPLTIKLSVDVVLHIQEQETKVTPWLAHVLEAKPLSFEATTTPNHLWILCPNSESPDQIEEIVAGKFRITRR